MEEVIQYSQPAYQVTGWSPKEMVPYLGLNVVLFCWHIWHLAAAIARSALVSDIHVVQPLQDLISATMATLLMGPLGNDGDG